MEVHFHTRSPLHRLAIIFPKNPLTKFPFLLLQPSTSSPRHNSPSFFATGTSSMAVLEQPGGKMVVELVGTFNQLTQRIKNNNHHLLSTSSSRLLFKTLKLCLPILQTLPLAPDGRSPLSRALSIALLLADLQV